MASGIWRRIVGWIWLAFLVPVTFVVLQFFLSNGIGVKSHVDIYVFPFFPVILLLAAVLGIGSKRYTPNLVTDAFLLLPLGFYFALVILGMVLGS